MITRVILLLFCVDIGWQAWSSPQQGGRAKLARAQECLQYFKYSLVSRKKSPPPQKKCITKKYYLCVLDDLVIFRQHAAVSKPSHCLCPIQNAWRVRVCIKCMLGPKSGIQANALYTCPTICTGPGWWQWGYAHESRKIHVHCIDTYKSRTCGSAN